MLLESLEARSLMAVAAANIGVIQNDTGNAETSVSLYIENGTPDFQMTPGSSRGDYYVQLGNTPADDVSAGILITNIRENGRDNGETGGTAGIQYTTSFLDIDGTQYFIPLENAPDGVEYNTNVAAGYFRYDEGWLGGRIYNAAGTNGGANDAFSGSPRLQLGTHIIDRGGGTTTIDLRTLGISSQTDGVLLANGAKNEDNYALVQANVDGTWTIYSKDNGTNGADHEQDPVSFVYVPTASSLISGKILGNGSLKMSDPGVSVVKSSTQAGTYQLSIAGQTPQSGVLLIVPDDADLGTNVDNIVTYAANGNGWQIQTYDLPQDPPTLQNLDATSSVVSFVFIPYQSTSNTTLFQQGINGYTGTSDTQLLEASPGTAYGTDTTPIVDFPDASNTGQALLRFANLFGSGANQVPANANVVSAYIVVTTSNPGDGGQMYRMLQAWDNNATWNSLNGGVQANNVEASSTVTAQVGVSGRNNDATPAGQATRINVTEDILAWQSGVSNNGWAILPWTSGTDGWEFFSSEAAVVTNRPRLVIEWTPASTTKETFRQGVDGYTGTLDTDLVVSSPDANNGNATGSAVDVVGANLTGHQSLLWFSQIIGYGPGQIPPLSTVQAAYLTLVSDGGDSQGDGGAFHRMLMPWTESSTWNSLVNGVQPDNVEARIALNTIVGSFSGTDDVRAGYNDFIVTGDLRDWVSGSAKNFGWAINPNGGDAWGWNSSEAAAVNKRPELRVAFTPAANPTTVYVEDNDWDALQLFDSINDADLGTSGNQSAQFGVNAFSSIADALLAVALGGTIIVNGGTYAETLVLANNVTIQVTGPDVSQTAIVSGSISGNGTLTKTGPGTLTLAGGNSFTGGINHAGGIINVTNSSGLGAGTFTWQGHNRLQVSVNDGSTWELPNNFVVPATGAGGENELLRIGDGSATVGTTLRLTGVVNGGASGQTYTLLDSDQTGNHNNTLVLTNSANTFSGTIEIWRGTLAFTSDGALGNAANKIRLNAGGNNGGLRVDAAGITLAATRNLELAGSEVLNTQGFDINIASTLSGGGQLRKLGAGKATFTTAGSWTQTGIIDVQAGNVETNSQTLTPTRRVNLAAGTTLISTGTLSLDGLTTTGGGRGSGHVLVTGSGQLLLRNASSSGANPDIFYSPDAVGSTADYNAQIGVTVDLGTANRYLNVNTNQNDGIDYGGDLQFNMPITGSGGLIINSTPAGAFNGSVGLFAANTFTGNVTIERGFLHLMATGSLGVANSVTMTPAAGNTAGLYLYGRDNTIGALANSGAGTAVVRNGAYTVGMPAWIVASAATLTVAQSTTTEFAGIISDGPTDDGNNAPSGGTFYSLRLTKGGAGTLRLSGANTYTGGTTISAGTLEIGAGGTAGVLPDFGVVNNGTLAFNRSDAVTFNSVISGSGNVTKADAANLTLGGANTFSGGLSLNGGGIYLTNASGLGTGTFTISTAAAANFLDVSGLPAASQTISNNIVLPSDASATTRVININGNTGSVVSFSGNISGGGSGTTLFLNTSVASAAGIFRFSGNNTFVTTPVNGITLNRGSLQIDSNAALGAAANSLWLDSYSPNSLIFTNSLTGAGAFTHPTTIDFATSTWDVGANTVEVASIVGGGAGLTKTGSGLLNFTTAGALNMSGAVTVSAGTLRFASNSFTSGRVLNIAAGAVAESAGTLSTIANASAPYNAVAGAGTLKLIATTNSASVPDVAFNTNDSDANNANYGTRIAANIDLGSTQRYLFGKTNHNGFGVYSPNSDAVISGGISGAGGITWIGQNNRGDMEAPLVLSGANTFTGTLEIARGSVYLNNTNALSPASALSFSPSAGNTARLFLYGNSIMVSSLSSTGAGTVQIANGNRATGAGTALAAVTLTVNQATSTTFAGSLSDAVLEYSNTGAQTQGSLSLIKSGAGSLALNGASTYTGTTTVTGGTLGGDGSVVSPIVVQSPAVLAPGGSPGDLASGALTLSSGSSFAIEINNPTPVTGYDQLVVTGAVSLGGATLAANISTAQPLASAFVLIKNDGTDAVVGTFLGRPEGSTVAVGGVGYRVSYVYNAEAAQLGTGNDVALIRVDPPVAVGESFSTNEDVPLVENVKTNDTSSPGFPANVVVVTQPNGTLVMNTATGQFTYTPPEDFSGTTSFTYYLQDGDLSSATVTTTITVIAVADEPTINFPTPLPTGGEMEVVPLGLTAVSNDNDGSESVSITISNVPANAVLVHRLTLVPFATSTFTAAELPFVAIRKADDNLAPLPDSFPLTITATATETTNGSTATTTRILTVTVNNLPPEPELVDISVAGQSQPLTSSITIVPGVGITFGVTTTDPAADSVDAPFRFVINWGDGTATSMSTTLDEGELAEFTHIYTVYGTFPVTLTVTDKDGSSTQLALTTVISAKVAKIDDTLFVGAGPAADRIVIQTANGGVAARINNVLSAGFSGINKVVVFGMAGADTISVTGNVPAVEFYGGAGDDYLAGGNLSDTLDGGDGTDRLIGGGGDDLLLGGAGNDTLAGGAGNDLIFGDDYLDVQGNQLTAAIGGKDTLNGDAGNDQLSGGAGLDTLYGGTGNDLLRGGNDSDTLDGGDGNDILLGEAGGDKLYGRGGLDVLIGGGGIDNLLGGVSADLLYSGDLADTDNTTLLALAQLWFQGQQATAVHQLSDIAIDDLLGDSLNGEGDTDWYVLFKLDSPSSTEKFPTNVKFNLT